MSHETQEEIRRRVELGLSTVSRLSRNTQDTPWKRAVMLTLRIIIILQALAIVALLIFAGLGPF